MPRIAKQTLQTMRSFLDLHNLQVQAQQQLQSIAEKYGPLREEVINLLRKLKDHMAIVGDVKMVLEEIALESKVSISRAALFDKLLEEFDEKNKEAARRMREAIEQAKEAKRQEIAAEPPKFRPEIKLSKIPREVPVGIAPVTAAQTVESIEEHMLREASWLTQLYHKVVEYLRGFSDWLSENSKGYRELQKNLLRFKDSLTAEVRYDWQKGENVMKEDETGFKNRVVLTVKNGVVEVEKVTGNVDVFLVDKDEDGGEAKLIAQGPGEEYGPQIRVEVKGGVLTPLDIEGGVELIVKDKDEGKTFTYRGPLYQEESIEREIDEAIEG